MKQGLCCCLKGEGLKGEDYLSNLIYKKKKRRVYLTKKKKKKEREGDKYNYKDNKEQHISSKG